MNTFLVVFGAFMITFIGVGIGHAFGLYLVPMTEYLNIGRETFGLAFALQVLIGGLGASVFGALSDKYGSGIAAFTGTIFFLIGLVWFANVQSSFDIIASQIIFGIGVAGTGVSVVLGAVGRSAREENRTLLLGIVMAGGSLGQFIVLPLATLLLEWYQWSTSLIYLSIIASYAFICPSFKLLW